ncbi:DUF6427 family protein [Yeosuana aromativorans]|uniref:DUF6427 family protein n=1 Tax=Yeosuana aromativorans TaxID=288019 RepID=UPI00166DE130|nr:DUF6427 family protein [Yeosuana aromativorans]
MITSVFSKSKPINFVIVFFIMVIAFTKANQPFFKESMSFVTFVGHTILFFACYFSILTFNFIVGKNSLTKNNHYQILLFGLFFLMFPKTTLDKDILFANFFVLLGLRRVLSLRTPNHTKNKLFDAAFWFGIAALFYFWAILFFVLIFITLLLYTDNRIKNWIVPFVGLITVFVLFTSISIVLYDDFFGLFNTSPAVSYNYNNYDQLQYLIAITVLFSFGVWSSIFFVKIIKKKKKVLRPSFKVVFVTLIIAFVISILAPQKNGSEFLFLFAPLSIVITNYVESIEEQWFKELFLAILIVVPLGLLVL